MTSVKPGTVSDENSGITPRPPLNGVRDSNATSQNSSSSTPVVYSHSTSDDNDFTQLKARYYGEDDTHKSSARSFLILGIVFGVAVLCLGLVYLSFPSLEESEKEVIKVPLDFEAAKALGKVMSKYTDTYFYHVLLGFLATYIFLQSFAIPGSIFLSILSGYLFPFPVALFFVCFCSATGASFCYILSYLVGRRLVWRYLPERAAQMASVVQQNSSHLLWYIIFLRITPFLPNWFINVTSPVVNVPIVPFFVGTFLGVCPPSLFYVNAGTTLHELTSHSEIITFTRFIGLLALGFISLAPALLAKVFKKKLD